MPCDPEYARPSMFGSTHQLRAFISALLLVVQVLGLAHVVLAEHALDASGSVADVAPQLPVAASETHSNADPHLCGHSVTLHAEAPHACMVVAGWTAPAVASSRTGLAPRTARQVAADGACVAAPQFDALSSAPKTSPPQV